jgi:cobalt-zinc-cadmium resistance protein CzcA
MNQSMLGSWRQFIGVAGVEIPIFNKAQKARVQASKITSHIQELEFEKMKHQLENEVIVLGKGIEDTQKNIDLINDVLLRESEKIMQVTMKKYMAGQLDYYDWYLTYNQNVNYKLELLNLQKNKNLSITNIKYLTGNE